MGNPLTQVAGRGDEFRALLEPGAIRAVFQPIVRLSDASVIGYEGLARFPTPPGLVALPPDVTLAAAAGAGAGLREEIEVACWAAIAAAGVPPHGRLLWVNLSPEALGHPGLLEVAGRLTSRLVIELTEQDTVLNHTLLARRLQPWIARGALVAVDDAGAGFTSLEYVADIRPDFLKLSRGMVAGVDGDPSREAVLRATVAFAREVGARVVAEGVERPEELEILSRMEIDYGQGWLFGRPSAPWPHDAPAAAAPRRAPASGRLERDLERAACARDACDAIADHLSRRGLLPSVYLVQGDRLRCQAVRGYWQIFDGIPATTGLIGRCFRTGEPVIIEEVGEAREYLPALPGVRAEACFPVRVAGTVVGVLNAESLTAIDRATLTEIERCAGLLSVRLEDVGAVPSVSRAQRLARAAARLASLEDPEAVVREALAAALELSGCESGLIVRADGYGALYPHLAEGPFAVALSQLAPEELGAMAMWVADGTSSYTVGDAGGRGFAGHEGLRRVGAASLIVLPLAAGGESLGMIVLADRANRRPAIEDIELLELLAGQAAGGLRMAGTVAELRARASRDPLTGLHASLPPLPPRTGVLLADVDGLREIAADRGRAAGEDVLRAMASLLREVAPAGSRSYRVGADEFVIALDAPSGASAEDLGWQLRALARARLGTTLSVGVAVGGAGESGEAVVARAGAALGEVKRRGGDGVGVALPGA
jgi:EAL domain-containing protein (putative c-di-GMP-specific phosphodiesterase class I)/GGDEF domain-containing protein/putative methionine-R-sulfoxide reductase with GAF domain